MDFDVRFSWGAGMESPNSNAQNLLAEYRRSINVFSHILCMFFPGVAFIVATMLFRGWIDPTVAYSVWALCSTALMGVGILRSKHKNLPAVLGTIIAIFGATYAFSHVTSSYPDQWLFVGWAFGMLSTMIWASLIQLGVALFERATDIYGWYWNIIGMLYMIVMFSIPFGLILLWAARGVQ